MSDIFVDLLPIIVGAAVVPLYPIVILFLLQSQRGLLKSLAFVSGAIIMRLTQGILFGFVFGAASEANSEAESGIIASTLLLVVGVLLLVTAFKKWRKEEDPDAPPPKWMNTLSGLTVLRSLGAGALFVTVAVKQWVFTLSALSLISEAELGRTTNVTLYVLYILAAQILGLLPILMYAVAPQQSAKPLQAIQSWLERHNRVILITVSLIFGTWFLFKGITGLIG